jgi:tRNA threonylcarbamoyladenosine biosynthesis protein TsaE
MNADNPPLGTHTEQWPTETACLASATWLARKPTLRHAYIELTGTLGAGKTAFVRHLLQALGVQGRIKSPTYGVMESYEVPRGTETWLISHFDFYRFTDPQEWEDAGFRDIFASAGLKLAEWPEQAAGLLPVADLHIHLEALMTGERKVIFNAQTPLGLQLLQR